MTAPATLPARLDPDRTLSGQFTKGNKAHRGLTNEWVGRYRNLVGIWWEAVTLDDMLAAKKTHMELILQKENPEVSLKALVLFYDRTMGKSVERIAVDVQDGQRSQVIDLSPEEIAVADRLLQRTMGQQE